MRYTEIKFSKKVSAETKASLGQYENEEMGLSASLADDDEIIDCGKKLVVDVYTLLGIINCDADIDTNATLTVAEKVAPKKVKTPAKKKKPEVVDSEPKKVEAAKAEEPKKADAPKEEPKKKSKAKTKKKFKTVPYDRTLDAHKKRMGEVCTKIFGADWRLNKEILTKVKSASPEAVGLDFIGDTGEILESFIEKFTELTK